MPRRLCALLATVAVAGCMTVETPQPRVAAAAPPPPPAAATPPAFVPPPGPTPAETEALNERVITEMVAPARKCSLEKLVLFASDHTASAAEIGQAAFDACRSKWDAVGHFWVIERAKQGKSSRGEMLVAVLEKQFVRSFTVMIIEARASVQRGGSSGESPKTTPETPRPDKLI